MKLHEAIALFLDTYDKETTRRTYAKALVTTSENNQITVEAQIGPGRDVQDITPADMVRIQNALQKRGYAPATLQQRLKSIKTFFNWLTEMEFIEKNPARVIKVKRPPAPRTRQKAMTDDELDLIVEVMRYTSLRDYALIHFLADTACRAVEVARLREPDIDWIKREAKILGKGDKPRQAKFGTATSIILRRWLLARNATRGDYVFSRDGRLIKPETLSQRVRRACYKLREHGVEIRTLSAHSLRHRKGHQFSDAKVSPTITREALGHESVITTLLYYYPDDWDTAAQELDKFALEMPKFSKPKAE